MHPDPAVRAELITELAKAAGASGMVGGQMLDLEIEGRFTKQKPSLKQIRTMQKLKTAALFAFASQAGAILGNAPKKQRQALERFGLSFGEAFQIADDLKDAEVDKAARKTTFVSAEGKENAQAELRRLVQKADDDLNPFGKKAEILKTTLTLLDA